MRLWPLVGPKAPPEASPEILAALSKVPQDESQWGRAHNEFVDQVSKYSLEAKYTLDAFDKKLADKGAEAWFFFDDLDEDLRSDATFRNRVLSGLFGLIQTGDSRKHRAIWFKVLLREDIWNDLTFQNKSHFDGRFITLHWRREDVLRLTLKQAHASRKFSDILRQFRPVAEIDAADEATLYAALEPLWGIRVGRVRSKFVYRWIYERLSDGQENFFPRAMQHLLISSKDAELTYLRTPSIQPKQDRLLRFESLVKGLKEGASRTRVSELREEYQELKPFMAELKGKKSPLECLEFERLWTKAGRPYERTAEDAAEWLEEIGMVRRDLPGGSVKVVDLYLWGLGMYRDGGP